jgi:nitrate reductase gamma subunit
MNIAFSLVAVAVIGLIPFVGVMAVNLTYLFGVIIPYAAVAVFVLGVFYRITLWGFSAVPYRIPTTSGQQKSLPWIKRNPIDNPFYLFEAVIRLAVEILIFRSLLKNTRAELNVKERRLSYKGFPWLWVSALAFHYAFLAVIVRHLRFFLEPIPFFIPWIETLDGLMEVGLPGYMLSGWVMVAALSYLFVRRIVVPQLRYISLVSDYFPLFLILCIGTTGILMRYFFKVDVVSVRELALGLATLHPKLPQAGVGGVYFLFYMHLFYVSTLVAYFPFSKLMHAGGVFMSPTRNLANNSRAVRHINPWNYPVKVHTYEEYEDENRKQMIEAGIPVERER